MTTGMDLLRLVADQIEAEPGSYDQAVFCGMRFDGEGEVCGSSHCVAGWALQLSDDSSIRYDPVADDWVDRETGVSYMGSLWDAAAELLEITDVDANELFDSNAGPLYASAAGALRAIASGAEIQDVWGRGR